MKLCAGMGLLPFHAGGKPEIWIRSERKLGLTAHVLENTPEPYVFESTMRELCVSEVSIFRYVLRSPAA